MSRAKLKANILGLFDEWEQRDGGALYVDCMLDEIVVRTAPPEDARRLLAAMCDGASRKILEQMSAYADRDRQTMRELNAAAAAREALYGMGVATEDIEAIIAKAEQSALKEREQLKH